ncbi:MAG: hypothetical protein Q8L37_03615 [Candidatus Gottesmanbacteria bacterium]|nr:hypothetical protein [Candidatus Gottesmanbacteria bacterium]
MNMQTISTKTLREDFSQVIAAMEMGQPLTLLYRSRPLAEIRPLAQAKSGLRSFTKQQLKQWIVADSLTAREQSQVDAIINDLP